MRLVIIFLFSCWSVSVLAQQTQVEVFALQHRLAGELVEVVSPLVAPEGVVQASGNNLIVRATPARLRDVRNIINQLDTAPKQLLISVTQGADINQSRQSASVSGRVGNGHGDNNSGVGVFGGGREDSNVILRDSNGNVIRGGVSDSTRSNQNNSMQQVRVLEGHTALIQVGQERPVVQRRVFPSVGRPVVIEQPGFQQVTTGFRVLPRVQGQQFTLQISPQQASLRNGNQPGNTPGVVDVRRLNTSVSGRLGEWVDIGGAVVQQSRQSSGIGARSSSRSHNQTSVLVKVDVLP